MIESTLLVDSAFTQNITGLLLSSWCVDAPPLLRLPLKLSRYHVLYQSSNTDEFRHVTSEALRPEDPLGGLH